MSPERNTGTAEQKADLRPVERFDRLFDQMMLYANGTSGSLGLPKLELPRGYTSLPVQFSIFKPGKLDGYETASYSPSITMESGEKFLEKGSGRIIQDSARREVQRPALEQFDMHDKKMIEALLNLIIIEEHFNEYEDQFKKLSGL